MTKKVKKVIIEDTSAMGKLLAEDKNLAKLPQVGDLIKGKVIAASKKEVLIDIEGLTTGIIRGKELYNESDDFNQLKPGDDVEATVLDMENEQGMLELSFRFAGHQKAWEVLEQFKVENKILAVKILDANKGGLLVTVNHIQGFLPVSQLNPEHYPRIPGGDKNKILEKLKSYVGETFEVKVMDVDSEHEKLIVSEKSAWEESQGDLLKKYQVGNVIEGDITAITDFGVFVKFGENLEGLAHISELAWQRIDDPNALFKVGQKIKAEIIKLEGSKIFLSIKKLQQDPWAGIAEKYKIGQQVEGKVIKVNPFGLFVELDKDIHGLAHVSELSDKQTMSLPDIEKIAKPGDSKTFTIVSIEPSEHRLGLSLVGLSKKKKEKKDEDKKEETKE
jgi:small subunit ribosomal protein S1